MNSLRRILYFLLFFLGLFLNILQAINAEDVPPPPSKYDYAILDGEWQRTDGGYLIKISDIQTDGRATDAEGNMVLSKDTGNEKTIKGVRENTKMKKLNNGQPLHPH